MVKWGGGGGLNPSTPTWYDFDHNIIMNSCKIAICLNGITYSDCWFNFPSNSFNLVQVNFDTLDKNSQCSPKRERKFVLLVALDR